MASSPLKLVEMAILGKVPKMWNKIQIVLVMMNRFFEIMKRVTEVWIDFTAHCSIFMDHWLVPYRIPEYVLTYIEIQFIGNFFEFLWQFLRTLLPAIPSCHLHVSGTAKRFDKTIADRQIFNVVNHQQNWAKYRQLLRYTFNTKVHCSTNLLHFRVVLS